MANDPMHVDWMKPSHLKCVMLEGFANSKAINKQYIMSAYWFLTDSISSRLFVICGQVTFKRNEKRSRSCRKRERAPFMKAIKLQLNRNCA